MHIRSARLSYLIKFAVHGWQSIGLYVMTIPVSLTISCYSYLMMSFMNIFMIRRTGFKELLYLAVILHRIVI